MKFWINVISKDQALAGMEGGFMQAQQNKVSSHQMLHKGDLIFFYSPGTLFRGGEILQAFTAVAWVADDAMYQVEVSARVQQWRRKATPVPCEETPIEPLIPSLDFIQDKANWATSLPRGLSEISKDDAQRIADAMHADING
jgi:hypothetical protein